MTRKLAHLRQPDDMDTAEPEPVSPLARIQYDFSKQIGHLLRKAYQRHTAIFQRICPDPQLTTVQFAVLCAVADNGPCSLTVIGRAACIDPATTRGVVERLRERKLITLHPDPEDARKVIVQLEDRGRTSVDAMVPYALEITQVTMRGLSVAEQVALEYLLTKVANAPEDLSTSDKTSQPQD
jgi:DNA-binding MarR family transcriptional regulator